VRDAGAGAEFFGRDLRIEFGHARGAARTLQLSVLIHRHAARVIAAVLEPLQAFNEDGDDIARADRADDAAHGGGLSRVWIEL
jgi:hypothetical protein